MMVDVEVPLRTLLVEDNRTEAALIGRLLLMASAPRFDVVSVNRLRHAEMVLAARRMDLVLLDLGLPDAADELDGVRRLHARFPDTPIVVLTGVEPSGGLRADVAEAGAIGCLFKQALNPEAMHEALYAAVRHVSAPGSTRSAETTQGLPQ